MFAERGEQPDPGSPRVAFLTAGPAHFEGDSSTVAVDLDVICEAPHQQQPLASDAGPRRPRRWPEPPAAITHAHAHAVRRDGCGDGDPPVLRQARVDDAVGDQLRDHQHDVLKAQLIEVPGDEADPATGFPRGGVISIQLERMAILRRGHGHGF
jgi:hypothetical protein